MWAFSVLHSRLPTSTQSSRALPFVLLAAIFLILLASSIPAPLYALFRQEYGLSAFDQTLIFVTHTVGVLAALFVSSRWVGLSSNRVRAVGIGMMFCLAGAAIFAVADGLIPLLAARLMIGLGAGVLTGPANAGLIELWGPGSDQRAAVASTSAFTLGAAVGPLLSGVFIQAEILPMVLPFVLTSGLATLVAAGLFLHSAPPTPLHARSPISAPTTQVLPVSLLIGVFGTYVGLSWAMLGAFMALGGTLAQEVFGIGQPAIIGYAFTIIQLTAGFCQLRGRHGEPKAIFLRGMTFELVGLALFALALAIRQPALAMAGILAFAMGYGFSFVGAASLVNRYAPAQRRGQVVSGFYLAAYAGNFLPLAVAALADHWALRAAMLTFIAGVAGLKVGLVLYETARARRLGA